MIMDLKSKAGELLKAWKGPDYVFGLKCIGTIGQTVAGFGNRVLLVANTGHLQAVVDEIVSSLGKSGLEVVGPIPGARPNSPKEDAYRVAEAITGCRPDCVLAVGGGSTIDVCKAASVLACLGDSVSPDIETYFGAGKVSAFLEKTNRKLIPLVAVQTSASSGSHLTKYSNITDMQSGQKKLIVDMAVVPRKALSDYKTTCSMPSSVTIDGALDALSHTIESYWGAKPETYGKLEEICTTAVSLVLKYTLRAIKNPNDLEAREALGLATDLGGYAIMVGGTSGGHLTSFSLVDCTSHGTACGLMNPYYAVFYCDAIQRQLKVLYRVFAEYGFADKATEIPEGRDLALAVAGAMIGFSRSIGAPTKLTDLPLFRKDVHIPRALKAAKDPDLKTKLQNMPVPMTADDVDVYMKGILDAACEEAFLGIATLNGIDPLA